MIAVAVAGSARTVAGTLKSSISNVAGTLKSSTSNDFGAEVLQLLWLARQGLGLAKRLVGRATEFSQQLVAGKRGKSDERRRGKVCKGLA